MFFFWNLEKIFQEFCFLSGNVPMLFRAASALIFIGNYIIAAVNPAPGIFCFREVDLTEENEFVKREKVRFLTQIVF